MKRKLFKVTVSTDILVFASDASEAIGIAKAESYKEMSNYCDTKVKLVEDINDIPENWINNIPYSSLIPIEKRSCLDIVNNP